MYVGKKKRRMIDLRLRKAVLAAACAAVLLLPSFGEAYEPISLTEDDAQRIGCRIFLNECSGKVSRLISWNEGEDFVSLGIGHFIWYPKDRRGPFDERFVAFLDFAKRNDAAIPEWLQGPDRHCPWNSRKEFLRERNSRKMCELRTFLAETVSLQLSFIVDRLKDALPKLAAAAPEGLRPRIEEQFYRLAATPGGIYALTDYVNFKGEGLLEAERYNGQGWGLLQVLERMSVAGTTGSGMTAVGEFARAAETILTERVANSPPERNERRWLCGWTNRLRTYAAVEEEFACEKNI